MDKSAIEQIQQTNTADVLNGFAKTETPILMVPESFKVVDLEKYQTHLSMFRGCFDTNSINDFIKYTGEYSERYEDVGQAELFIDDENVSAKAIFDLGTILHPLHRKHTAVLKLKKTSAYSAMLSFVNHRNTQIQLSDILEDWATNIQVLDEQGAPLNLNVAITGVRKITISRARELQSEVGDFSNSASVSERIEATQREKLPAKILFTCKPYSDLKEREFVIRIALLTSSDEPTFSLRQVGAEEQQEDIINEFRELLETRTKTLPVTVYRGDF